MLIDLEDNKITIYYLKLKGKEYKLIIEFPSPIINKKKLYEKYDSTTSKRIINNKCFDTNCYKKKSNSFMITLPRFVYFDDIIIEHEDIFDQASSTENLKKSSYISFKDSNILELLIKGNKIGPTSFIKFHSYIDYDIFKEKTGYENMTELIGKPSLIKTLGDIQELYSINAILKEKCYIDYRIEIA